MDSVTYIDDEMVIDEGMSMDETSITDSASISSVVIHPSFTDLALLDPALFSSSTTSSPTPDSALTTFSSETTEQEFPSTNIFVYRHAGCGCKVKLENYPDTVLEVWERPSSATTQPPSSTSPAIIWITFPLNCKMCTWAEWKRLKYTTKARCAAIKTSSASKEIQDRLRAYEKGVRDGRYEALVTSIDWSQANGTEQGGGLANGMAKMMAALNLGKVDEGDELAVCMEQVSLEYDELTHDLMRLFECRDLRAKGRLDGLGIQARMEIRKLSKRL